MAILLAQSSTVFGNAFFVPTQNSLAPLGQFRYLKTEAILPKSVVDTASLTKTLTHTIIYFLIISCM